MSYNFGSMFNETQLLENDLLGDTDANREARKAKRADRKTNRIDRRADRKADRALDADFGEGSGDFGTAMGKGTAITGNAMDFVGKGMNMLNNMNLSEDERMGERGNVTHDVDWAGNIGGMTVSGAMLGGSIVPGWGHVIGAGVGLIAGTVGSVIDSDNQPDADDIRQAGEAFDLGNMMQTVRGEDMFARQQTMSAEFGMNIKGNTKKIEVEQDELVLRKTGKSFKKVADFKGGKSHEMGGEQYVAAEGDVIIPGKDRLKVNRMLKNRRWSAIESLRQKLPSDTGQQMAPEGMYSVTNPDKKALKRLDKVDRTDKQISEIYSNNPNDIINQNKRVPNLNFGKYGKFFKHKPSVSSTGSVDNIYNVSQVGKSYNDQAFKENIWPVFQTLNPGASINYNGKLYDATAANKYSPNKQYKMGTKRIGYAQGTKEIMPSYEAGVDEIDFEANPEEIKRKIYDRLVADGYTPIAAKGIITNMSYETDGFTAMEEYNPNSKGSKGYGIVQWTGTRRKALEKYMKTNDKDINDVDDQMDFFFHEIKNNPSAMAGFSKAKINKLTSIEEAADLFMKKYERPSNQSKAHLDKRMKHIEEFDKKFPTYPENILPDPGARVDTMRDPTSGNTAKIVLPEDTSGWAKAKAGITNFWNQQKAKGAQLDAMMKQELDLANDDPIAYYKQYGYNDKDIKELMGTKAYKEADKKSKEIKKAVEDMPITPADAPPIDTTPNIAPELRPEANIEDSPFYGYEGRETGVDTSGGGFEPSEIGEPLPSAVSKSVVPAGAEKSSIGSNVAKGLGLVADYMPALYNIVRGTETPSKVPRNFVSPQTRKYTNMGQPQMNAIDMAFEASLSNARNLSGGMMGNYRSNVESAWARKLDAQGKVNLGETMRADQIAAENIAIKNRANEFNVQVNTKADIMDMQSEATTKSFMAQGMQDIANINAVKRKDENARRNENLMLKMIGSENFDIYGFKG